MSAKLRSIIWLSAGIVLMPIGTILIFGYGQPGWAIVLLAVWWIWEPKSESPAKAGL